MQQLEDWESSDRLDVRVGYEGCTEELNPGIVLDGTGEILGKQRKMLLQEFWWSSTFERLCRATFLRRCAHRRGISFQPHDTCPDFRRVLLSAHVSSCFAQLVVSREAVSTQGG